MDQIDSDNWHHAYESPAPAPTLVKEKLQFFVPLHGKIAWYTFLICGGAQVKDMCCEILQIQQSVEWSRIANYSFAVSIAALAVLGHGIWKTKVRIPKDLQDRLGLEAPSSVEE